MGSHRTLPFAFVLPVLLIGVASALAQGPAFGIGRTPTPEEIKALDISTGPTGEELPPGKGTVKEGEQLYRTKGCAGCHGAQGTGARGRHSEKQRSQEPRCVGARTNPAAARARDYINRGMPLNREGTLTADEV